MQTKLTNSSDVLARLTAKQRRALPLLAAGYTGAEVAKTINVNRATVSQWQNHDVDFAEALDQCRWESLRSAQDKLCSLANGAVAELEKLLKEANSEQVKLKAAELILNTLGLNQGSNYQELVPPKPQKTHRGQYDLDKILDGLGVQ